MMEGMPLAESSYAAVSPAGPAPRMITGALVAPRIIPRPAAAEWGRQRAQSRRRQKQSRYTGRTARATARRISRIEDRGALPEIDRNLRSKQDKLSCNSAQFQ